MAEDLVLGGALAAIKILPALAAEEPNAVLALLDQLGCGAVLMDGAKIIEANETAVSLGQIHLNGGGTKEALRRLVAPVKSGEVVMLQRAEKRPIAAYKLGRRLVVLVDLERSMVPRRATLMRLFDLTKAEAVVARHLAAGESLEEISARTGVAITTVRTQLARCFDKTGTKKQGQLVALLTRVACLP